MAGSGRKLQRLLMGCGAMAALLAPAMAQETHTSDPKWLYSTIDCRLWTLNPDGTWSSGPDAHIGNLTFSNTMYNTMKGYVDNGVDAETALLKKCGKR